MDSQETASMSMENMPTGEEASAMAKELSAAVETLIPEYGPLVVGLAADNSNFVSIVTMMVSNNVPGTVVVGLTECFARVLVLACHGNNVEFALVAKVSNIIDGYKKTLIQELADKLPEKK
jgi:hypothetical protein